MTVESDNIETLRIQLRVARVRAEQLEHQLKKAAACAMAIQERMVMENDCVNFFELADMMAEKILRLAGYEEHFNQAQKKERQ